MPRMVTRASSPMSLFIFGEAPRDLLCECPARISDLADPYQGRI
jgi:hypothetical protein